MNCDLIAVLPSYIDFPPYRYFLQRYGVKFQSLINIFSEHHIVTMDYTKFFHEWIIRQRLAHFPRTNIVVEGPLIPPGNHDWRDHAVNMALANSHAEYVWFIEPDFLTDWTKFLAKIEPALEQHTPVIGFYVDGRLHPACLIVQRSLLEKTSKDFSPKTPEYDHFGRVAKELTQMTIITTLEDLGLEEGRDWYHMAGLSRNYQMAIMGEVPNHNLNELLVYNARSRELPVEQNASYLDTTLMVENLITKSGRFLNF